MAAHDPALARLIDQVQQALQDRSPLDIRGGGTKLFYGGPAVGQVLDLRELRGISSYEPTELVVTARAAGVADGTGLDIAETLQYCSTSLYVRAHDRSSHFACNIRIPRGGRRSKKIQAKTIRE